MDGTSIKVHMDAMVTLSFLCHQQVLPTDVNANSFCVSSLCHEVEQFFFRLFQQRAGKHSGRTAMADEGVAWGCQHTYSANMLSLSTTNALSRD
jgi:hypothetical protein